MRVPNNDKGKPACARRNDRDASELAHRTCLPASRSDSRDGPGTKNRTQPAA